MIYRVDYCLIKLKTMSVGEEHTQHEQKERWIKSDSLSVISYWYLCHVSASDFDDTKEGVGREPGIPAFVVPFRRQIFKRHRRSTAKKINGNMFNLILSINNKYFDDIIIKDVKCLRNTDAQERWSDNIGSGRL